MTKQTKKQKHDKQRAQKRKHEHETEAMAENSARKKRAHVEEWIAIIVLLAFVPFMVLGAVFWPGPDGKASASGGVPLKNGTYTATYLSTVPATGTTPGLATLDVGGNNIMVTESALSGPAARNSTEFFQGQDGQRVQITVQNGFITNFGAPK